MSALAVTGLATLGSVRAMATGVAGIAPIRLHQG